MKMAVDIGNSNVVIGIHHDGKWQENWRMITKADENSLPFYEVELRNRILESQFKTADVEGIILSSVVPKLRPTFETLLNSIFQVEVDIVGPELYKTLNFDVPRPYEIGTDLVANAYGAYKKFGQDCVVIDFGTALTFTTVSNGGYVEGVAIAPGIKTAMRALSSNTAQLPEIPLELPDSALGKNTTHAIQSGILWGYVGMVKELIAKIRSEVGDHYIAVATGGLSFIMNPLEDMFHAIDRDLTIDGLLNMLNDLESKK